MTTASRQDQSEAVRAITWKTVVRLILAGLIMPALLFAFAGRFDWWMGWAYTAIALASMFLVACCCYAAIPICLWNGRRRREGIKG
jgi:hypothetical protein